MQVREVSIDETLKVHARIPEFVETSPEVRFFEN